MFKTVVGIVARCKLGYSRVRLGTRLNRYDNEDLVSFGDWTMRSAMALLRSVLSSRGYYVLRDSPKGSLYGQDGLFTVHNHDFIAKPEFADAYARGLRVSGGPMYGPWRMHIALWVARSALSLRGDFIECGVGHGVMSSAIMHSLNWNALDRTFYLLDTFSGLDPRHVSEAEMQAGRLELNQRELSKGHYATSIEAVRATFAEWHRVEIIKGSIPETLHHVGTERIAFLHVDMNCAAPEVAALEYFWPRIVDGAFILLDDYAYVGYREQKLAMDKFAGKVGVEVLSLPTGQGLIVKRRQAVM